MKPSPFNQTQQRGIALLEVLFAVAILCSALIGATIALQRVMDSASLARRESDIERELSNHLAVLKVAPIKPGRQDLESSQPGMTCWADVKEEEGLKNKDNQELKNLWRITVSARWKFNNREEQREVFLLRSSP